MEFMEKLLRLILVVLAVVQLHVVRAADGTGHGNPCLAAKLSSSLRAYLGSRQVGRALPLGDSRVCAFVRLADGGEKALLSNGCKVLARFGDIVIADISLARITALASDAGICRIEAESGNDVALDSMAVFTDALPVYNSSALPQAYTGSGVVMGVQDVGFDLTHPTFYDHGGRCRISRLWDQLSADTIGSTMYVGAEYVGAGAVAAYAHSRDGLTQYHGTHTLGIAAGGGAGTPYRGMAPEADICLVANAVTGDEDYIDEYNRYKYTYATDALGFKYIFDYADSQDKPCVISFSEGSKQDMHGDDRLYYEVLGRMTGPGRIIVASAGNEGVRNGYVGKPRGRQSAGTFITSWSGSAAFTVKGSGHYRLRSTLYNIPSSATATGGVSVSAGNAVIAISPEEVAVGSADSTRSDTVWVGDAQYVHTVKVYRSCYDHSEWAMDVAIDGPRHLGYDLPLSAELVGADSSADMYMMSGTMCGNADHPSVNDADNPHSLLSPSTAPAVICVGGTACRPVYSSYSGKEVVQSWGVSGERGTYSSVGPTIDGRAKPDVMAPGANVVSAVSSYYLADAKQAAGVDDNIVLKQNAGGREYCWMAAGGTSMSAPAVGGIIALWLQANPRLTPDDILGIIARTSRPCGDYGAQTHMYCGYGMIDAYRGLLDILGLSGVEGIVQCNPRAWNIRVDSQRHILVEPCACSMENAACHTDLLPCIKRVRVYDADGTLVCSKFAGNNTSLSTVNIDMSAFSHGVYVVQVDAEDAGQSGSLLVRI